MIKDKLMKALKTAAADYNNGMGADMSVACAAEAWDFNEKQAERLVEMFNTAVALNKQAGSDPTGTCELANKEEVARILFSNCSGTNEKKAGCRGSGSSLDSYLFYVSDPERTNRTIEARRSGMSRLTKKAESVTHEPEGLDVSQRSLFKIINEKISLLKSAADAADDVVRAMKQDIASGAAKIARAVEDPFADACLADMFKAACGAEDVVSMVSEYSTKVAESNGGKYASSNVFDPSPVEGLLKIADEMRRNIDSVGAYEKRRDFYLSKAAGAYDELSRTLGLGVEEKKENLSDFLKSGSAERQVRKETGAGDGSDEDAASVCVKIAEMLREAGIPSESVERLAEEIEKDAAVNMGFAVPMPSVGEAHGALTKSIGIDSERKRMMNFRRSILLADLMSNDPIIRDADPNVVVEAYKTMVMSSPRVSLDKAQVRSFLRSAVNSVAISPNDAKVITDVDKGIAFSNGVLDRLTERDSSIKDSNE